MKNLHLMQVCNLMLKGRVTYSRKTAICCEISSSNARFCVENDIISTPKVVWEGNVCHSVHNGSPCDYHLDLFKVVRLGTP